MLIIKIEIKFQYKKQTRNINIKHMIDYKIFCNILSYSINIYCFAKQKIYFLDIKD